MHTLYFLIGIFEGIIIGILVEKYVFPYFEILFEVFTAKRSEEIAAYNANIQSISCDLLREYPELSKNNIGGQNQTNAIGFECQGDIEEEYYEDWFLIKM